MTELRERWERDEKSNIESAKEEGREEGIKEGRKDNQIEIVKEMIKKKYDIEIIQDITKLSREEIERIRSEIYKK